MITASQAGDADWNSAPDVQQLLTVNKATATVTLTDLEHTYDGTPKAATVTTDPAGLTVVVTYDGAADPPNDPSDYAVVATVDDHLKRVGRESICIGEVGVVLKDEELFDAHDLANIRVDGIHGGIPGNL